MTSMAEIEDMWKDRRLSLLLRKFVLEQSR